MTIAAMLDELRTQCAARSIDELKAALEPLLKGYRLTSPVFDTGMFLYRARKVDDKFRPGEPIEFGDLRYPPAE